MSTEAGTFNSNEVARCLGNLCVLICVCTCVYCYLETQTDIFSLQLCTVLFLQSGKKNLLQAAVLAIGDKDTLWQSYLKDFVANRFGLNVGEDNLTRKLHDLMFAHPLAQLDSKKKLVMLHTAAHTNQINLAKLVSGLRPFQELQKVVETIPVPAMSTLSASATLMSAVEENPKQVQNPVTLYQYIIDILFEALAGVCLNCGHEDISYYEPFEVWRDSYRDVVCTPPIHYYLTSLLQYHLPFFPPSTSFPFLQTSQTSVKQILFHSPLRKKSHVGKLNTMAAVFFLLQVRAELDVEICSLAFQLGKELLEQYFNKELQVSSLPQSPEHKHVRTHTHAHNLLFLENLVGLGRTYPYTC